MEKILEVKNIEKYYGTKTNLNKGIDNISFEVEKGEFVRNNGSVRKWKNDITKLHFNHR